MEIVRYSEKYCRTWDEFVVTSRNGTFLHQRGYMDYHRDRFVDHSLILQKKGEVRALLPAAQIANRLISHAGLTYGGLILGEKTRQKEVNDCLQAIVRYAREQELKDIFIKTIPAIYHQHPSDELEYALWLNGAQLDRIDTYSVIDLLNRIPIHSRRKRAAKKAQKLDGFEVEFCEDWSDYWGVLSAQLQNRFDAKPVHSLEEIQLLASKFPKAIKLLAARVCGELHAGIVLYVTPTCVHAQYIASDNFARDNGLLDAVFLACLDWCGQRYRYFSFGISNENGGKVLNENLIAFKEGFGATTMTHKFFRLQVQ